MKIKLLGWCLLGRQGDVIEVSDIDGRKAVKRGLAVEVEEPKAEKREKKVKKPKEVK